MPTSNSFYYKPHQVVTAFYRKTHQVVTAFGTVLLFTYTKQRLPKKGCAITSLRENNAVRPEARRWVLYLVKAFVLLVLLVTLSNLLPHMPPVAVAVVWAVFSSLAALGFTYHAVIKKIITRLQFQRGGSLATFFAGHAFKTILGFCAAAILIAGLFIEMPLWRTGEWVLVALSIPLFIPVFLLVEKWVKKEFIPELHLSRSIVISSVITSILLCIGGVIIYWIHPLPQYANAAEAYLAAKQPLADATCALLAEVGKISALTNWFPDYILSLGNEENPVGIILIRCILFASAAFGFVTLLGTCAIEWDELKRVFIPLRNQTRPELPADAQSSASVSTKLPAGAQAPANTTRTELPADTQTPAAPSTELPTGAQASAATSKPYLALAAVLPICLMALFLGLNSQVEKVVQTGQYTAAEQFIHDQVNLVVYSVDGKYLDARAVENVLADTQTKGKLLSTQARTELIDLINQSFDTRIANIDSYLDWYYSLPADYDRLLRVVTNQAEEYAEEQFSAYIEAGVDTTRIDECMTRFNQQLTELEAEYNSALDTCEIKGVPDWLVTVTDKSMSKETLGIQALAPANDFTAMAARLGISATAGTGVGIGAAIASRVIGKQVFKKVSSTLVSKIIGAAAGPLGIAVSFGVDYLLLKADEHLSREEHKKEILDTLEQQRSEVLALVGE